jgi:hypothetical protein
MPGRRQPTKYVPLVAWLQALPADCGSAELSFAEIETILGGNLPASAWDPAYWRHAAMIKH